MVCMSHRLQCATLHFPKHKFPVLATRNVEMQLKSTVERQCLHKDKMLISLFGGLLYYAESGRTSMNLSCLYRQGLNKVHSHLIISL